MSRRGEKWLMAAFDTMNPIPQITATDIAISISRGFILKLLT
jgi:hypothetical protein